MIRTGTFQDYDHGHGSFIALGLKRVHILIALRSTWNFMVDAQKSRGISSLFLGPLEIEVTRITDCPLIK